MDRESFWSSTGTDPALVESNEELDRPKCSSIAQQSWVLGISRSAAETEERDAILLARFRPGRRNPARGNSAIEPVVSRGQTAAYRQGETLACSIAGPYFRLAESARPGHLVRSHVVAHALKFSLSPFFA